MCHSFAHMALARLLAGLMAAFLNECRRGKAKGKLASKSLFNPRLLLLFLFLDCSLLSAPSCVVCLFVGE